MVSQHRLESFFHLDHPTTYLTSHEFHATCHSITFYFMKKSHFWHFQVLDFAKYDWGGLQITNTPVFIFERNPAVYMALACTN